MVFQFGDRKADTEFFRTLGAVDELSEGDVGDVALKIFGVGENPDDLLPAFHLLMRRDGEIFLECYDQGGKTLGKISLGRKTKRMLALLVSCLKAEDGNSEW